MDMKKVFLKSSFIKLSSLLLLLLYVIHPFINGVGCDYHSQSNNGQISTYTTCKLGMIDTAVKNHETKKSLQYKGIYGKSGDTVIFIVYDLKDITGDNYIHKNVTDFFSNNKIFVSKVLEIEDADWILLEQPYYTVLSAKRVGRLSFF